MTTVVVVAVVAGDFAVSQSQDPSFPLQREKKKEKRKKKRIKLDQLFHRITHNNSGIIIIADVVSHFLNHFA